MSEFRGLSSVGNDILPGLMPDFAGRNGNANGNCRGKRGVGAYRAPT